MAGSDTQAWLEEQVAAYAEFYPIYLRFGEVIERVLEEAARRHAPLSIIKTRTKQLPSFAEKCLRKQAKYRVPSHQLTDLLGARIITRTASEVRAVCSFIEAHLEIDWENSDDVSERLGSAEFGYRSIHYVVALRRDADIGPVDDDLYGFECTSSDCPQSGGFHPLKAEIQVRTMAEHAWADFAHDLTYKGAFELPQHWRREIALMAADLEDVDRTVARIEEGLRTYAAAYGTFLEPDDLAREIETLETVLGFDPDNAGLGHRIGKLAMTAGDWERAAAVMGRFIDDERPEASAQPLLRDLGVALGKVGDTARGRRFLEMAAELDPGDSDAIASLAGTWRGEDSVRAAELYLTAFEADPTDYYPLLNYVDGEIERTGSVHVLDVFGSMATQALARCRSHIEVGMNVPWSVSSMAKFSLLLGDPYAALDWYARSVLMTVTEFTLPSLERTRGAAGLIAGHDWCDRFLELAGVARFGRDRETLRSGAPIEGPVIVVAGDTGGGTEQAMAAFGPILDEVLRGFAGTVISGGTTAGVCGLVGDLGSLHDRVRTIGYVPGTILEGSVQDDRYDEIRTTAGTDFTPLESLEAWADIVASGVDPADVVVLGFGGGDIAAAEYRMALALGARVGLLQGSGRAASRMLSDPFWSQADGLSPLPMDAHTVRAFAAPAVGSIGKDAREALAKELHRTYREEIAAQTSEDPSLRPWEALTADLRGSNLDQVDAIVAKVEEVGCTVVSIDDAAGTFEFTDDEVELLAEMEHGRWTANRLRSGWRWGPNRDADARVSPYVVPWAQVPDNIREYDREFVRRIPGLLAGVGLGIVRG